MDERKVYIYGLYEIGKEDEIRYVGKTLNIKDRLRSHIKNKTKSNLDKIKWINYLKDQNKKLGIIILEVCGNNWSKREK